MINFACFALSRPPRILNALNHTRRNFTVLPTASMSSASKKEDTARTKALARTMPDSVDAGPYRIEGISIAADETCLWVPSLSLAIDTGRCPRKAVNMRYVAVTHGHCDHVHGLPLHAATRALQKLKPATYFVPREIVADVRSLVDAVSALERTPIVANLVPLAPDSAPVELKPGWSLCAIRTDHSVPSQGYVVYHTRRKRREEFANASPDELKAYKAKGISISSEVTTPELVFTGDTSINTLRKSRICQRARVLVTEMTFLRTEHKGPTMEDADRFGHIHFDHVTQNVHLFEQNEVVVFTHFSARYSPDVIRTAMNTLPQCIRKKAIALGAQ